MLENYETAYGIYDHDVERADRPFAAVEMHPAEDNLTDSLLYERMRQFAYHGVADTFNISWNEYLALPCYDAAEIMEIASVKKAKDGETGSAMVKQFAALGGKLK